MKSNFEKKIIEISYLRSKFGALYKGKSVGLCHGVFDVLHSGHIEYFKEAATLVDILVISVTSDKFVNKGSNRPINNAAHRMISLAALESVDYVIESNDNSAIKIIQILKPNFYFKGKDYDRSVNTDIEDNSGFLDAEINAVKEFGGKIYFTKSELKSSSKIINSSYKYTKEQQHVISHVKNYFERNNLKSILNNLSSKNISIIGEIILDKYIFTESLGKSGKHPIVAEKEVSRKEIYGGIIPVAHIIKSFVGENYRLISVHDQLNNKIENLKENLIFRDSNHTEIIKTRFINDKTNTFMYELYEMNDQFISLKTEKKILNSLIKLQNNTDLLIVLDFGHGLLTPKLREFICAEFQFTAINAQRNAGNRGFNNIGKYSKADIVVLNGEEVELEFRQKKVDLIQSAEILHSKLNAKIIAITDGSNGLILSNGKEAVRVPAIHTGPIADRTGAGDTLFAILSLFSLEIQDLTVLGYLGNLAGSMNLTGFGNEIPITADALVKTLVYGLK